jgi:hypothetical protein
MNLIMKRFGANVTLPSMVVLWGVICACQGQGFFFITRAVFLTILLTYASQVL